MFLAYPITKVLNASFKEQRLPSTWKLADVTPIPKRKPVKDVKKDLRPISLTPCLSKLAEDLVVTNHVKPAALRVLDDRQYGAVPKSSTTLALLEMIHCWMNATDGNGSSVKTILFDYRKAFDQIDHKILITKLSTLNLPYSIINRIIDFLPTVSKEQNLPKDVYLNGVWCPLVFLRVPNWAHGSSSSSSMS